MSWISSSNRSMIAPTFISRASLACASQRQSAPPPRPDNAPEG